ncbi:MAG: alanine racemase [Nitrosomonas sp.]|nr:alanine racemase [Nitrosomonas sp.]
MSRPIHVLIDLSALEHNLSVVRHYAPHARVMAVIKANAYGHGLLHAAKALKNADGFAMLELDAAICLRKAGYHQPILLLEGFFSTTELVLFKQYNLSAVIHHKEQLMMLAASVECNRLDVFVKINTGMNRLGFAPEEFPSALHSLETNPAINQISLMTHLANADDLTEKASVTKQLQCFDTKTMGLKHLRSLANSAAIMQYPETHADWVRPGIMLYGASPFSDRTAAELGLKPVMTVSSKLIAIQNLEAGDKVGYRGQFQATHAMRIGIVAGGYADGYPRHALTGTPVLVNGQRTHTLGFVSMDMLAVDLSHIENAELGSPVILWGKGLPVDEVASTAGTISYELLCAMASRVESRIQGT